MGILTRFSNPLIVFIMTFLVLGCVSQPKESSNAFACEQKIKQLIPNAMYLARVNATSIDIGRIGASFFWNNSWTDGVSMTYSVPYNDNSDINGNPTDYGLIRLENGKEKNENVNYLYVRKGTNCWTCDGGIRYSKMVVDKMGVVKGTRTFSLTNLELVPSTQSSIILIKENPYTTNSTYAEQAIVTKLLINRYSVENCNWVDDP